MVILDTDIGTDGDDAWALATALSCPELRLVGLTIAYGNTSCGVRLHANFYSWLGAPKFPWQSGNVSHYPAHQLILTVGSAF
jgi:purine nucleosidase